MYCVFLFFVLMGGRFNLISLKLWPLEHITSILITEPLESKAPSEKGWGWGCGGVTRTGKEQLWSLILVTPARSHVLGPVHAKNIPSLHGNIFFYLVSYMDTAFNPFECEND